MPDIPSVLHIVENLDRGAVENWLVRMLKHARRRGARPEWTFYCALGRPGVLDDTARAAGARIVYSPVPLGNKVSFVRALRTEIKRLKPDVMHCHHDLVSAVYLVAAIGLDVKCRIVHVHNADEHLPTDSALKRRLGLELMRRICLSADRVVGISNHTLDTMLGGCSRRPSRDIVHFYGVDPSPFTGPQLDRAAFRRSIQVSEDAPILLFGGRIVPEKNPVFAVDVLATLRRAAPTAVLVYAGAGSLENMVRDRARALEVEHAVRLIGWRNNLPTVMGACDLFILPRPEQPMEGFGLAVVEAQLAGMRLLLSRGIPNDPLLPTACVRRLALAESPEVWAKAAVELLDAPQPDRAASRAALAASPMDMDRALDALTDLYT